MLPVLLISYSFIQDCVILYPVLFFSFFLGPQIIWNNNLYLLLQSVDGNRPRCEGGVNIFLLHLKGRESFGFFVETPSFLVWKKSSKLQGKNSLGFKLIDDILREKGAEHQR